LRNIIGIRRNIGTTPTVTSRQCEEDLPPYRGSL
jgi:hypothetical protein